MHRTAAALAVLLVSAAASAEAPVAVAAVVERPKNSVTVNPAGLVFGFFHVEYERRLGDRLSVFVEPSFFRMSQQGGLLTGPGLTAGVRIYPFGKAVEGMFIAPELYATYLDRTYDSDEGKPGFGAGAAVGYTFIFFNVIDLSLGLGAIANFTGYATNGTEGFAVGPLPRINIGAAF